jgi:hypothetical protein
MPVQGPAPAYLAEQRRVDARLRRLSRSTLMRMTMLTIRCPDGCALGRVYETGGLPVLVPRSSSAHAGPREDMPELLSRPDHPVAWWYLQCQHDGGRRVLVADVRQALETRPRGSSWVPPDIA